MNLKKIGCAGWLAVACGCVQADGFYAGLSVGEMDTDSNRFDDGVSGGVLLGYEYLRRGSFGASVEAEFTTTLSKGDYSFGGDKGDWDVDTQALHAAFYVGDPVYIKARFGAARSDLSANAGGQSFNDTDNSFTWGSAAGWRITQKVAAELSYTVIDADFNYISLGVLYDF